MHKNLVFQYEWERERGVICIATAGIARPIPDKILTLLVRHNIDDIFI